MCECFDKKGEGVYLQKGGGFPHPSPPHPTHPEQQDRKKKKKKKKKNRSSI